MEDITIKRIIEGEKLENKVGLFSDVIIHPGKELAYHEHHGETETYYVLSGEGEYNDNGTKLKVKEGDILYCPDGNGHGMKCLGDEDIRFIALIIKK